MKPASVSSFDATFVLRDELVEEAVIVFVRLLNQILVARGQAYEELGQANVR